MMSRAALTLSMVATGMLCCHTGSALAARVAITIVDAAGNPVGDAVIALTPVGSPAPPPPPDSRASLDQISKTFSPHVLALQAGTLVYFPNSDNIRHQVYSFSEAKRFETKLYSGKVAPPVLFDKPGVVVLGCNIHDSMRAYVYVIDSPYFATTDAQGHGSITAPSGPYAVSIWHPRYKQGRTAASADLKLAAADQALRQTLDLAGAEE